MLRLILTKLQNHLRRFRDDTRGSVTVEFALMMPLLFWVYGASYVFFDGYRQSAINLKTAYTIGDLLSRETDAIDDTFIDSIYALQGILIRTNAPRALRVSVVRWDEDTSAYSLEWTSTRGSVSGMTENETANLTSRLPSMSDEDRVILVETWNTWEPPFTVGLPKTEFQDFVFTRPRFAPQLVWAAG